MAPEQALGQPIDRRADVWAMGAILYHLLSGKPPFEGPNQLAALHALASGKTPQPLPATVPPAVAAVILRALTHKLEDRFATAAELQTAIEATMASSQLATTPADVATFMEKHMADRAANRRDAIAMALAAAEERARMQELLKPPNPDSSISNVGGLRLGKTQQEREALLTVPGFRALSPEEKLPPPPSVPTQATLGLAAVSVGSLPMRSHRNAIIAAVGVVGIGLGIAGTVALRGGAGNAASTSSAASTTPVATGAATTTAPPPVATATPPEDVPPARTAVAPPPAPPPTHVPATTRAAAGPPRAATPAAASRKIPKVIANGF